MQTRFFSDLALHGALIMTKDDGAFPENPAIGTLIIKDLCLYAYVNIGGFETWYPFAPKSQYYFHSQGMPALTWTINHNLNTTSVWIQVQDLDGNIINPGKHNVDANSFQLTFTEACVGVVLVVGPESLNVPEVRAALFDVGGGVVVIDNSGVKINGAYALTQDTVNQAVSSASQAAGYVTASDLALVATTGLYTDLINAPAGFSGAYADLTGAPTLATVATSGSYVDLTNKPTLFSGSYADLTNKPTIPTVPTAVSAFTNDSGYQTSSQVDTAIQAVVGAAPAALNTLQEIAAQLATDESAAAALTAVVATKATASSLATVATSGSYADLTNKPTIPTVPTVVSAFTNDAGYQTAANVATAISGKANTSSLATVATSGSYTDLTNKPTIPSAYTLPTASTSTLGGVKVDGTTITISNGVITSVGGSGGSYTLPVATASVLGGVKTGTGVSIAADGTISTALTSGIVTTALGFTPYNSTNPAGYQTAAQVGTAITNSAYSLPVATASVLGGVKAGTGVSIAVDGTISATGSVSIPYDFSGAAYGKPAAGTAILRSAVVRGLSFPAGLTGSVATCDTVPTATAVCTVKKNGASFGTISFAANSSVGTFAAASTTTFSAGDTLTITAPTTVDATFGDIQITLVATLA